MMIERSSREHNLIGLNFIWIKALLQNFEIYRQCYGVSDKSNEYVGLGGSKQGHFQR